MDALTAAVEAYDIERCAVNDRAHGGKCQLMSDANRTTIRPMIAAAVRAYLAASPALEQLIDQAERLVPSGEIGDGTVAQFHELAGRARRDLAPPGAYEEMTIRGDR